MRRNARAGFTLLELSVVIIVISVVVAVGISLGSDAITFSNRFATQERLKMIDEAIDSFRVKYGHLPCPARMNLRPGIDPNFGEQDCAGVAQVEIGAASPAHENDVRIGMVPIRALQLPDYFAADAWNNKLLYAVSELMAYDEDNTLQGPTLYAN